MDVRIGVTYSPREIELELADDVDRDAVKALVEGVIGAEDKMLWLTDRKGREVGVPSSRIAFIEIGSSSETRAIGFSS